MYTCIYTHHNDNNNNILMITITHSITIQSTIAWGNTNRVVSNRVVSKVTLYPSTTEIDIFVVV